MANSTMPISETSRYARVFSQRGKEYLYVDQLGMGRRGIVQRILHFQSGEGFVRKVSHPRLPAPKDSTSAPDLESALNDYFKTNFPGRGQLPNIAEPLDYTVVRYPFTGGLDSTGNDRISHVLYYKFYNLGNLHTFLLGPGRKAFTAALIARFVSQIIRALAFLYSLEVVHCDLHEQNIYVHLEPGSTTPDFYIGDFNLAIQGERGNAAQSNEQINQRADLTNFFDIIHRLLRSVTGRRTNWKQTETIFPSLYSVLEKLSTLKEMIDAQGGPLKLPSVVDNLIAAADLAEEVEGDYLQTGQQGTEVGKKLSSHVAANQKEPEYFDGGVPKSVIVGPWSIAQVDIASRRIMEVEDKTYLHSVRLDWKTDSDIEELNPLDDEDDDEAMEAMFEEEFGYQGPEEEDDEMDGGGRAAIPAGFYPQEDAFYDA